MNHPEGPSPRDRKDPNGSLADRAKKMRFCMKHIERALESQLKGDATWSQAGSAGCAAELLVQAALALGAIDEADAEDLGYDYLF